MTLQSFPVRHYSRLLRFCVAVAMPSATELQLGAPLSLFALVIAQSQYQSCVHVMVPEPPECQSILTYTSYSWKKAAARGRKRVAIAAIRIAANIFLKCNLASPAGVCTSVEVPCRLDKLPKWLGFIASLPHREALSMLASSSLLVPDKVYRQVELEFNAGIAAASSTQPCLAQLRLQPGSLAQRIACLNCSACESTPRTLPVGPPLVGTLVQQQGAFFYIGAGVGCGIREALQVCSVAATLFCSVAVALFCCCYSVLLLFRLSAAVTIRFACIACHALVDDAVLNCDLPAVQIVMLHALQEGYRCCGACEIDRYCQMVRRTLSPGTQSCTLQLALQHNAALNAMSAGTCQASPWAGGARRYQNARPLV
jgi:hypothetical protein